MDDLLFPKRRIHRNGSRKSHHSSNLFFVLTPVIVLQGMVTKFLVFQVITLLVLSEQSFTLQPAKESTVQINTERSIIRWKGTKVRRTGSHEGTIRFKEGRLILNEKNITGGELIVDMNTIEVTDIPADDPIPRNGLKSHLESDFEISRFSTAKLIIKGMGKSGDELCGNLTIKGITREICFSLQQKNAKSWRTKLILLRDDFRIGEQGSWLEKKLVDQEMELDIEVNLN